MHATTFRSVVLTAAAGASLALLAGCPFVDSRTTNQGGGNLITAAIKVATEQIATLTPDEVQVLTDTVSDVSPDIEVNVTDEQAAAAVEFLVANNVYTIADIERLVEQAENDPGSIRIPDAVVALIEAGNLPEVQGAG
jgi:hypothetical protein